MVHDVGEPNQLGSEEDNNEEGPREPENNIIENDNSLGGSAFGSVLIPSTLNRDDFNPCQDSIRRDEVIIQNQTRRFKTTNNQGKPAATLEQEKSNTQQNLINLADQATLIDPSKRSLSSWEDMEGRIEISLHGPCCHGPRFVLTITGVHKKQR